MSKLDRARIGMLSLAAVAAAALALSAAPLAARPIEAITGGPLEVGVLWPEGSASFAAVKRVGDTLVSDIPGTQITYTFVNTQSRPAIELRWRSGNPPDTDILFNGADKNSLHWVDEGALLDLTPALASAQRSDGISWIDAIRPQFRKFAQYNDRYYMIPDQAVVFGLHYNKKIFDQLGLQPPTTWDELVQVADTLKANGIDPIAVTGTTAPYMGQWWDLLLQREVGTQAVMDTVFGTQALADNPGFLRAARRLEDLIKRGAFMPGFEGTDFTAAQIQFFQGNVGMILMGSWLVTEMKDSIPPDFQIAIAPFPQVAGGQGDQNGTFGTVLGWSVAAKSKNPDLAVEFLRRTTTKDEQTRRVQDLGLISAYSDVPTPPTIPGLDNLLAQASSAEFTFYYYGIVFDKERTDAWYGPVSELFLKQITADQMITEIDANLARVRGQ